MLHGWLVVNHFLRSAKFEEIYQWLEDAAAGLDIDLQRMTNARLLADMQNRPSGEGCSAFSLYGKKGAPDFVLFWDKDIVLARYMESCGLRLYNKADAIDNCDNKLLTHLKLHIAGLPMPRTIASPMTYENIGYTDFEFLERISSELGFPVVVKAARGSFGQQVLKANSHDELIDCVSSLGTQPIVFQEFIAADQGSDLRLQVVGDKVIAAMKRTSANGDFRSNLTLGGTMRCFDPTNLQIELALKACQALQLDFAGVDLLTGNNGEPLVCEINSNAHFKTLYECTGVDTASSIMKHILSCQGGSE